MSTLEIAQKIITIIHEGSPLLILLLLVIYITPRIFRNFDLIAAIKGLHGLRRRNLEEIIKNKKINKNTCRLAKQELTALYNYQLTGIFNHELREPIVKIITKNNLPARYFKPLRFCLNVEGNKIILNEKLYNTNKKLITGVWGFLCNFLVVYKPCLLYEIRATKIDIFINGICDILPPLLWYNHATAKICI